MNSAPPNALLTADQRGPPPIISSVDPEEALRFKVALEALSTNTRRAYANAMGAWASWAIQRDVDPLAPPPLVLRAYLQERASAGAGISSLRLAVAMLRKVQALAGGEATANDQVVTDTIRVLARKAAAPRQAYALTTEALAAISATACQPRVGRGGWLETQAQARQRGLVDIALCRVLSDAGLRRSEAVALVWADVAPWEDGSGRLTVRQSKTDAEARTVYLTPAAVAALEAIRPAGAKGESSVFGLSESTIARRVKAAAAAAGLGLNFSGHSGRVGMARRMAKAGAPTHEIMAQGRWKTARMVEVYTRAEEAGRAAQWLS